MIRDETANRKQSSISILNTSYANRSVDSNAQSTHSYLNQIKMNNCSNSFSTLSLNFQTKAVNRTDIMSYALKRPELDIEELYDKEMESYLSLAKKEEFNTNDLKADINLNSDKMNKTINNNFKMMTFGKEINNNNISTNASNSTLQNAVNKTKMVKSVSKSIAPIPHGKDAQKKNEVKSSVATANIKKIAPNAPVAKKGSRTSSIYTSNLTNTPKRETYASVGKTKSNNVSNSGNSGNHKVNESLLNSVKKVTKTVKATVVTGGNSNASGRSDNKILNSNKKEISRTSSVVRSSILDKNFNTKEDTAKKFASIDKKINKK